MCCIKSFHRMCSLLLAQCNTAETMRTIKEIQQFHESYVGAQYLRNNDCCVVKPFQWLLRFFFINLINNFIFIKQRAQTSFYEIIKSMHSPLNPLWFNNQQWCTVERAGPLTMFKKEKKKKKLSHTTLFCQVNCKPMLKMI